MNPARHTESPQPGQGKGFSISETLEQIKDEFGYLQNQYHALKMDLEKLSAEKTDMQRQNAIYYEMSYDLNVELQKQTEIVKRLNTIIAQIIPHLPPDHQLSVTKAVERGTTVTTTELRQIIGQHHFSKHWPAFMRHQLKLLEKNFIDRSLTERSTATPEPSNNPMIWIRKFFRKLFTRKQKKPFTKNMQEKAI